jgi:hypothetical protein
MNIDNVGRVREPLHLAVEVLGPRADVVYRELVNPCAVQQFLLERINIPQARLNDIAWSQRGFQAGFHTKARQA